VAISLQVLLPGISSAQVDLVHLGTYATGIYNAGASEISAYDAATRHLFVTNGAQQRLDILSIADPTQPQLVASIDVTPYGSHANSVAARGGVVAVAMQAADAQANGKIVFFDAAGTYLGQVPAGAMPDMLTFTPDGTKVISADEGEPNDAYTVDPRGSVTIVDLSAGVAAATAVTLDFTAFDHQPIDPRIRIYGPNATVSTDLEPEYVAVSPDSRKAWVTLQENNALAIVDLSAPAITGLVALGFKDHSLAGNGLDASDQGGVINIRPWPVIGMYLPDGIAAYGSGGATYLLTANEGDTRAYSGMNEEARVSQLNLDDAIFPDEAQLKQNVNLGRLKVTNKFGDTDGDGDYDALYSFGARSFSVWDSTGALVWDSGQALEELTAAAYPANFNASHDNNSLKNRSDDKGPEPEGMTTYQFQGRTYAFVGFERIGGVAVFDVTNPSAPTFVVYRNHRDFGANPGQPAALDLGPEGLLVIPASASPTGSALLVTSNEISGTTSIFHIDSSAAGIPGNGATGGGATESILAAPNPAHPGQAVSFRLPVGAGGRITIVDCAGRIVRTVEGTGDATGDSASEVRWDGRDRDGKRPTAGVYYVRAEVGPDVTVRKLVLR
jgi:hypothetical protein